MWQFYVLLENWGSMWMRDGDVHGMKAESQRQAFLKRLWSPYLSLGWDGYWVGVGVVIGCMHAAVVARVCVIYSVKNVYWTLKNDEGLLWGRMRNDRNGYFLPHPNRIEPGPFACRTRQMHEKFRLKLGNFLLNQTCQKQPNLEPRPNRNFGRLVGTITLPQEWGHRSSRKSRQRWADHIQQLREFCITTAFSYPLNAVDLLPWK